MAWKVVSSWHFACLARPPILQFEESSMLGKKFGNCALLLGLMVVSGCLLTFSSASAVEIDKGLQEVMATKANDMIPVLMIYHDPVRIDNLTLDLDRLSPDKRRKSVLEALKKKNRKLQTNALLDV